MNARAFRTALGSFATGVTIVTTRGPKWGAHWQHGQFLQRRVALWSFGRRAYSFKSYLSSDHFAVNILREGQEDVSRRFSRSLDDKWTGLDFETWDTGCPNALAVFECKMAYTYQGGDHVIFVGEVLNFDHDPTGRPLVFWHGDYRAVADHAD
jgi:3-hydroxy-9,10-secoandrosta-1,3,5(10)-triene-9,17-dione monooxygenase reductase component